MTDADSLTRSCERIRGAGRTLPPAASLWRGNKALGRCRPRAGMGTVYQQAKERAMPWQCRLVDKCKDRLEVGDMWYVDHLIDAATGAAYCEEGGLSDDYVRDHAGKRAPLAVVLPNGDIFGIDTHITGSRRGWTVTGEPPNITVSPSINCVGRYHGFLTNGVLSDDYEGHDYR